MDNIVERLNKVADEFETAATSGALEDSEGDLNRERGGSLSSAARKKPKWTRSWMPSSALLTNTTGVANNMFYCAGKCTGAER